jgi:hypothetical protein
MNNSFSTDISTTFDGTDTRLQKNSDYLAYGFHFHKTVGHITYSRNPELAKLAKLLTKPEPQAQKPVIKTMGYVLRCSAARCQYVWLGNINEKYCPNCRSPVKRKYNVNSEINKAKRTGLI